MQRRIVAVTFCCVVVMVLAGQAFGWGFGGRSDEDKPKSDAISSQPGDTAALQVELERLQKAFRFFSDEQKTSRATIQRQQALIKQQKAQIISLRKALKRSGVGEVVAREIQDSDLELQLQSLQTRLEKTIGELTSEQELNRNLREQLLSAEQEVDDLAERLASQEAVPADSVEVVIEEEVIEEYEPVDFETSDDAFLHELASDDLPIEKVMDAPVVDEPAEVAPLVEQIEDVEFVVDELDVAEDAEEVDELLAEEAIVEEDVLEDTIPSVDEDVPAEVIVVRAEETEAESAPSVDIVMEKSEKASELFQAGKISEARELFEEVLAIDEQSVSALMGLAACDYAEGKMARANARVNDVLALAEDNADALGLQGILVWRAGNPARALEILQRAASIAPQSTQIQNYLGIVLHSQGRLPEAADHFIMAAELDPTNVEVQFNLAVILATSQPPRIEEAKKYYEQVLQLGGKKNVDLETILYK